MPEILVYIGAAVMVVLAVLAYRYWNSTAEFARRAREDQARLKHDALIAAAAAPTRPDDSVETTGDTAGDDIPLEVPIDSEVVEEVQEPDEIDDVGPPVQNEETDQTDGDETAGDQHDETDHAAEEQPDETDQTDQDDTAEEQPDHEDAAEGIDEDDELVQDDTGEDRPAETDEGEDSTEGIEQPDEIDQTDQDDTAEEQPDHEDAAEGIDKDDELLQDDTAEDQPAGTSPVEVGEDDSAREELEDVEDEPVELVEDGRHRSPEAAEGEPAPDEEFKPDVAGSIAYRLIDELEPQSTGEPPANRKTATTLLENLDEQLAALPTGIELMELPTVERRRVADLRKALEKDRVRLLEQRKRGAHRRRRRRRNSPNN